MKTNKQLYKLILSLILFLLVCDIYPQVVLNKIVISRNQSGNDWDLWLMNRDGTNQIKLIDNNYRDTGPYFNTLGTKIVFGRITAFMPYAADVYIVNSDGTNEINLTTNPAINGPALSPKFSPDGTKIVFDVQNSPGNGDIYMINTDGTGLIPVLTDTSDDSSPHFSPDGQWIVFQRMVSMIPNPKSKICKKQVSGGSVVDLTRGNDLDEMPCWSPDGNFIIFKRGDLTTDICRITFNHNPMIDTDIVNLTNSPNSIDDAPRYSIEGDKIGFMSTHGYNVLDSMEIYIMNPDGTNPQRITFNDKADFDPAFSPLNAVNINTNNTQPLNFKLEQNYPNPFNSGTKIKFDLPESGLVILKIFNSLGQEVMTLINEQLASGTYEITFDATGYPSGVYFYKLITGKFIDTKKMFLIK